MMQLTFPTGEVQGKASRENIADESQRSRDSRR